MNVGPTDINIYSHFLMMSNDLSNDFSWDFHIHIPDQDLNVWTGTLLSVSPNLIDFVSQHCSIGHKYSLGTPPPLYFERLHVTFW